MYIYIYRKIFAISGGVKANRSLQEFSEQRVDIKFKACVEDGDNRPKSSCDKNHRFTQVPYSMHSLFLMTKIWPRSESLGAFAGSVGPRTLPRKSAHDNLEASHSTE